MRFLWDPDKDTTNRRKHGIGFDEVHELFEVDSDFWEIFDEHHSVAEERFIAVGSVKRGVVVVETIWPNAAYVEGIGVNVLVGSDPIPPNGGAPYHDIAVWIRAA